MHLKVTICLTLIILTVNLLTVNGKEQTDPSIEFKMRFKDLSLKTICEEEEWKHQFEPIKEKFAKCLGLKKIITDDDDPDADVDRLSFFKGESHNPYCRITKTWDACTYHLKGLNCIESNAAELLRGRSRGFMGMNGDSDSNIDPDNINAMTRVYKMQCDMAKLASNYGPFGSRGYGMDYFGGYEMPPDIAPEGDVPPEGDF